MGTYLGFLDEGRLVALAGERMHPDGWTEISAVCTDPRYRKRGLSTRLVRAVGHGIRTRGEIPFLHARADNHTAIRLYESLGFTLRQRSVLTVVRTPGDGRQ
jgi:predicted GNAT family acetyltransferase